MTGHSCDVSIGWVIGPVGDGRPSVIDYRVTCRSCGIVDKAGLHRLAVGRAEAHEAEHDAPAGGRCEPGFDLDEPERAAG
jgi:hypothetical protein